MKNLNLPINHWYILGIVVLYLGLGQITFAANVGRFQEVSHAQIRGVLVEVPLRVVVSELQENLELEFIVAEEELDRPISVQLSGETFLKGLPKIFSSWDYALQRDEHGQVRKIYLVRKTQKEVSTSPIEDEGVKIHDGLIKEQIQPAFSEPSYFQYQGVPEDNDTKTDGIEGSSIAKNSEQSEELSEIVKPSATQTPMKLIPSSDSPPMIIASPSETTEMQILPASAYPPMEIFPVSEVDRQAFGNQASPISNVNERPLFP